MLWHLDTRQIMQYIYLLIFLYVSLYDLKELPFFFFDRGFSKEFDPCIDQIVDATLAIHRLVQTNLLPVPEKSHYIFNLRDFSKIIQVG